MMELRWPTFNSSPTETVCDPDSPELVSLRRTHLLYYIKVACADSFHILALFLR